MTPEDFKVEDITINPEAFSLAEGEVNTSAEVAAQETKVPPVTPPVVVSEVVGDYKYNPIWDDIKTKYNIDIPETVKTGKFEEGKKESDYLSDIIINANKSTAEDSLKDIPEMAKAILELHKKGQFDENTFLEERSGYKKLENLSDNDFLKQHYIKRYGMKSETNPKGLTEEVLEKIVNEKTASASFEYDIQELREKYKDDFENEQKAKQQEKVITDNKLKEEFRKEREVEFEEFIKETETMNNVLGIPIGKAERDTYNQQFKTILTPDDSNPVVGLSVTQKMYDLLTNDKNLYQMIYALSNGDKKTKDIMANLKYDAKQEVLDKTNIKPRQIDSSINVSNLNPIDPEAFDRPDPLG